MSIDSTFGTDFDNTLTDPGDDTLPVGSEEFTFPPGVNSSFGTDFDNDLGSGATGYIARANELVSGVVSLTLDGAEVTSKSLSGELYTITGVPAGVASGENRTGTDSEVRFDGEDGSVANKTGFSGVTTFNVNLGELTVTVNDVDGNPVSRSPVTIDGAKLQTDSDGQVVIGSSGTPNITALLGSRTKSVSVPAGGSASTTFTFSGVEGKVKGPTGNGVIGRAVVLKDSDGDEITRTETDEDGVFKFSSVPVSEEVTISTGKFDRSFNSAASGVTTTKNLPFNIDLSGVQIKVSNVSTGDRVVDVDVQVDGFSGFTGSDGIGSTITTDDGEKTVIVAREDRRFIEESLTLSLVLNDTVEGFVELEENQNIGNY